MSPQPTPAQLPAPSPDQTTPDQPTPPKTKKRTTKSEPPAAAVSGTGSSADNGAGFLADPGPEFDPRSSPAAPDVDDIDRPFLEGVDGWEEATIRDLLVTQGNVTNWVLRLHEDDETWKQTEDDLRAISRPVTRILNRYDATRAAAAAGDEIALVAAVTAYGARNYTKRRRIIAQIRAQGPQPVSGVAADPGTGPEDDPEYQRIHEPPPALKPKGVR